MKEKTRKREVPDLDLREGENLRAKYRVKETKRVDRIAIKNVTNLENQYQILRILLIKCQKILQNRAIKGKKKVIYMKKMPNPQKIPIKSHKLLKYQIKYLKKAQIHMKTPPKTTKTRKSPQTP